MLSPGKNNPAPHAPRGYIPIQGYRGQDYLPAYLQAARDHQGQRE